MSEVTTIQTPDLFTDLAVLEQAVTNLQAQGMTGIMTGAEFQKKYNRVPTAHFYFANNANYNKVPGAEREGEELAVVLNTTYADVAGISKLKGDLIGGVHRLETPAGQESPTEADVRVKMLALRKEYNTILAGNAAQKLAARLGGRVHSPSRGKWVITVNGSLQGI